jgi:protein-disulfide isomerase
MQTMLLHSKAGRMRAPLIRRCDRRALVGAVLMLFGLGIAGGCWLGFPTAKAAGDTPRDAVPVGAEDVVLGSPDSRAVVIEYFSFSCPHCERFHREVFPLIRAQYLDTGRLLFVLRDFPLNLPALKAAQTAWCGGRDRYVEIHDALWADWDSWINLPAPDDALVRIAAEHGIAPEVAAACLTDPAIEQRVLKSYLDGERTYEIEGTPTFIVNGKPYRGYLSFERFERALAETAGQGGG